MTRPQIVVNVAAALQRRGAPTDTGVAFLAYQGATGSEDPVECLSAADAVAAEAPATVAALVGEALTQGAPKVVIVRAADGAEVDWDAALDKFSSDYGPGQVLIPGVTGTAHAALLAHVAARPDRCALLDVAADDTATEILAIAAGLSAAEGANRAALLAGSAVLPGPAGTTRTVPGSVIAAGLIGRNDAFVGHANNAPAGDQGRGAGFISGATGLSVAFTDAELDALHDAGVSVFRTIRKVPQLYGWVSLSPDPRFRQFNHGRIAMQLSSGIAAGAEKFLFRQIDGQGHLFAELEGMLRGYLEPLYAAAALYGATPADAYDVDVQNVNTPATIQAGELHATVAVSLTAHAEKVIISVVTNVAEGVAA